MTAIISFSLFSPISLISPISLQFLRSFTPDRDTDLGHKFVRIVGNAIINERDLTGKANYLHSMFFNIIQQFFILYRRFRMTAAKTNPHTERFRQVKRFSCVNILLINVKKMPSYCEVSAFLRCSAEIPSPTFPRKTTASASD